MKAKEPSEIRYLPVRDLLRRRLLVRWGILAAVAGVFVALYFIACEFCTPNEQKLMLGLSVLVYIYIVWKSRAVPMSFAREWTGTVLSCEVMPSIKNTKGVTRVVRTTLVGKWKIRRDSVFDNPDSEGEEIILRYDTDALSERYFLPGDRVRMYANATYPVKLHPSPDDFNLMCPLCSRATCEPRCERCKITFYEPGTPEKKAQS